ncbi:hypothetical protein E1265_14570 [Streptomyces sp. 8K308]|uniref:hypothetical protein n=1 Tax=Streptomyces sp. 8K308 TaxID=2530388 RepID=UPI00104B6A10|nr:hypothetical protein [Streptomyces sp. 8K308]TDC22834.1 hypothetical protein E1265_14570 [Streptomyces sp. 8K308]
MTAPHPLPDWIPPASAGARTVPAGRWFDAVEVPSLTSAYVLGRLDARSGPVVELQDHGFVRWFVAPRAAAGWPRLPGMWVLGHGHYVAIPPAEWCASPTEGGPPIRWLLPPRGRCLTGADALHAALAATLLAPARPGARRG